MPNVSPALTAIEQAFRVRGLEPMQYFSNSHLQPPGLQQQFNAPPTPPARPMPMAPVPAIRGPAPTVQGMPPQSPMPAPAMAPQMQQGPGVTELSQQLSPSPLGPSAQLPGLLGMLSNLKPQQPNPGSLANIRVKGGAGANALGKSGFTMRRPTGTVF